MSSDGLPCSTCPILDLGTRYPPGDMRDPWRRMPKLFRICRVLFGDSMMAHSGQTRLRLEKLMGHYCKTQRSKYGLCTKKRAYLCSGILQQSVIHGRRAGSVGERHSYVTQALRAAVNDDETCQKMKATIVQQPTGDMRMPPITFQRMPAA